MEREHFARNYSFLTKPFSSSSSFSSSSFSSSSSSTSPFSSSSSSTSSFSSSCFSPSSPSSSSTSSPSTSNSSIYKKLIYLWGGMLFFQYLIYLINSIYGVFHENWEATKVSNASGFTVLCAIAQAL